MLFFLLHGGQSQLWSKWVILSYLNYEEQFKLYSIVCCINAPTQLRSGFTSIFQLISVFWLTKQVLTTGMDRFIVLWSVTVGAPPQMCCRRFCHSKSCTMLRDGAQSSQLGVQIFRTNCFIYAFLVSHSCHSFLRKQIGSSWDVCIKIARVRAWRGWNINSAS